jgi:molybdopterin/thiamine biosynthesis adenylyltransferase
MDFLRQIEIFKPHIHGEKRIDLLGVGATGSYICFLLSKEGMNNIHVWDYDIVEPHNIPNQIYFERNHIGMKKVEALKSIIKDATDTKIICHDQKVTKDKIDLGSIIFLLTDTMSSRTEIFNSNLKNNPSISCVIETRMGSNSGRVYTFNPNIIYEYEQWQETLCGDDEAEVSACGGSISIASTASLIASIACWQMKKVLNRNPFENEVIINTNPWFILSRNFKPR